MRLSDQAMGALMMALQKCLMDQSDITELLKKFNFVISENEELVVENPPVLRFANREVDESSVSEEKVWPKEEDF